MTGIGPIVSAGHVRRAAEATLQLWLPSVAAAAAVLDGRDPADPEEHQPVRTWRRVADVRSVQPDQLVAVSCSSGGLVDEPEDDGDGVFRATWGLVVAVQLRGESFEDTADRVGYYCAAVRTALAQHPDLAGFAAGTDWLGEDYALGEAAAARNYGAGFVEFAIRVEQVLDIYAGPEEPPEDPLDENPDLPEVDTVIVLEQPLD